MNNRLLAITPVDHPGGAETTLLRLLSALQARGWTISLTSPGRGRLRDRPLGAGYRWHGLALGGLSAGQGMRAIASWPRGRSLAGAADVVYLNGSVCGRVLPALPRVRARIVLHIHDMVTRIPRFWRRADVVLAASRAVAERLGSLRAHVVYPPVDPNPPERTAPWPPGEGPVIGFVGRIEPRKGPLDLVRAAPPIRRGAPGARIVLVGEDPYGASPDYTRAVLAEAMAVGTPVVASDVEGLPEIVHDGVTGRLVEPGRPERIAAAVLEVLAHRDSMSSAARDEARRFYVKDYAQDVERLISA